MAEVNRRKLLNGFSYLGAVAENFDASLATQQEIDVVWSTVEGHPVCFEIWDGVTVCASYESNLVNRWSVYSIGKCDFSTPDKLIETASELRPVLMAVSDYYRDTLEELDEDTRNEMPLEIDDDEEMTKFVSQMNDEEFRKLVDYMSKWADEEPDWALEDDYFVNSPSGQTRAYKFFCDFVSYDEVDALGMRIVEGDRPGSTYYAAELTVPIADANARAIALGLPIRFEPSKA